MANMIRQEHRLVPSFEQLFRDFMDDFPASPFRPIDEGALAVDLSENESEVIVRASLPGFDRDSIQAEVHDGALSIRAERAETTESSDEKFYRRERHVGVISRRIPLPAAVSDEQVAAALKDGVLTIRMRKSANGGPRKIAIT